MLVLLAAGSAATLVAATWLNGGVRLNVAGIRFTSTNIDRPFAVLLVLLAVLHWRTLAVPIERWVKPFFGASIVLTLVFSLWHAAPYAAAADMFGYLSQARDWVDGTILHRDWMSADASPALRLFPVASGAPLGYVYRPDAGAAVPEYPPGTSMLMAPAVAVAGDWGGNAITLVGLLALVFGTARLGRLEHSKTVAYGAAALLALSPTVILQTTLPMSDVPAAALWIWSLYLVSRPGGASHHIVAGVLAGCAVLVRPNLGLLGLAVFLRACERHNVRAAAMLVCGAIPGVAALLAFNDYVNGGILTFGYGPVGNFFSLSYIPDNVIRYSRWLWQTMGPLPFVGAAAGIVGAIRHGRHSGDRSGAIFVATNVLLYLSYLPWPDWPFLRFLLPSLPLLLIAGVKAVEGIGTTVGRAPSFVAIALLASVWWQMRFTDSHAVRLTGEAMSRYERIALDVGRTSGPRTVGIARLHSGSLRYYAGINTVRWDLLTPEELFAGIARAREAGLEPWLIVDSDETAVFEGRFGPLSCWVDSEAPLASVQAHATVTVYAMSNRCDLAKSGADAPPAP